MKSQVSAYFCTHQQKGYESLQGTPEECFLKLKEEAEEHCATGSDLAIKRELVSAGTTLQQDPILPPCYTQPQTHQHSRPPVLSRIFTDDLPDEKPIMTHPREPVQNFVTPSPPPSGVGTPPVKIDHGSPSLPSANINQSSAHTGQSYPESIFTPLSRSDGENLAHQRQTPTSAAPPPQSPAGDQQARKRDRTEFESSESTSSGRHRERSNQRPKLYTAASAPATSAAQSAHASSSTSGAGLLEDGELLVTPRVNAFQFNAPVDVKIRVPSVVREHKIGINHLDLLYETRGDKMFCRMCRSASSTIRVCGKLLIFD